MNELQVRLLIATLEFLGILDLGELDREQLDQLDDALESGLRVVRTEKEARSEADWR